MPPLCDSKRPPKPVQRSSKTAAATTSITANAKQATSTATRQSVAQAIAPAQQRNQRLELQSAANKQDQEIVTKQESLQIIKATLEAGVSTICYLRRLLPDDHFVDAYMASSIPPPGKTSEELYGLTQPDFNASQQASGSQSKVFKYPKIVSGASEESDKILRMVEKGVMDAVAKGYLRSFMFIIFLDNNKPDSIVESYTFNVFYAGAGGAPILDVRHELEGCSATLEFQEQEADSYALHMPQTHQAVRRSTKTLMKTLILGCQKMEDLPRRRYVDFKLAYNDSCPNDYEAPEFKDCTGIPLFMYTDEVDCPPIKIPVGTMATGSLGLSVTTLSIAEYLHTWRELEAGDTVDRRSLEGEIEEQIEHAERGNVIWNADLPVYDRRAYDSTAIDPYSLILPELDVPKDAEGALKQPLGRRLADGTIEPIVRAGSQCFGEDIQAEYPNSGKKRDRDEFNDHTPELSPTQRTQCYTQHSQLSEQQCVPALRRAHSLTSNALSTQSHHNTSAGGMPFFQRTVPDEDADGQAYNDGSFRQLIASQQLLTAPAPQEHNPSAVPSPQEPSAATADASAPLVKRTKKSSKKKAAAREAAKEASDPFTQGGDCVPPPAPETPDSQPISDFPAQVSSSPTFKQQAKTGSTPKSQIKSKTKSQTTSKTKSKTDRPKKQHIKTPLAAAKAALAAKTAAKKKTPSEKAHTKLPAVANPANPANPATPAIPATPSAVDSQKFDWVDCFCGAKDDEDGCMQCDGCDRWVHRPCVGYTGLSAAAHVGAWYCLACEMERDQKLHWGKKALARARSKMALLALFRRTLLIVRHQGGLGKTAPLKERLGCSSQSLGCVVARLGREGFITYEGGRRKKSTFNTWVHTPETAEQLISYFTPGGGVETKLFDYRMDRQHTPEEEESDHPALPYAANLSRRSTSIPPSGTGSLRSMLPSSITTRHGNLIPSLDGRPKSQYDLPVIRCSRAEAPIELTEDW